MSQKRTNQLMAEKALLEGRQSPGTGDLDRGFRITKMPGKGRDRFRCRKTVGKLLNRPIEGFQAGVSRGRGRRCGRAGRLHHESEQGDSAEAGSLDHGSSFLGVKKPSQTTEKPESKGHDHVNTKHTPKRDDDGRKKQFGLGFNPC